MGVHGRGIFAAANLKLGNRRAHRIGDMRVAPSLDQDFAIAVDHAGNRMRHHHAGVGQQPAPIAGMMAAGMHIKPHGEIEHTA